MKLYATLENSKGKIVHLADNETITATVYEGNKKQYSIIIDWCNVGDIEEPTMSSLISIRDWRKEHRLQYKNTETGETEYDEDR